MTAGHSRVLSKQISNVVAPEDCQTVKLIKGDSGSLRRISARSFCEASTQRHANRDGGFCVMDR